MKTGIVIKIIMPFVLMLLWSICFSCDNPTGPNENTPGRRDYTWTVDTVNSDPYKTLGRLWASSPTDVWVTGFGGDFAKDVFHFDGSQWVTGGKYMISRAPSSIYGFGPNDVYIGCEAGRIYHWDGTGMKEVAALTKDGHNDIVFDRMWGGEFLLWGIPVDLFATGAYPDSQLLFNGSVIAHYSNNKWTMLDTDGLKGIVENLYRNKSDNKIYLQVIKYSNTYDSTFIYEYSQKNYTELYKTVWATHWANISLINNEVYFVLNTQIAVRNENDFQTLLNLEGTNFYKNIWGRNSKDIFLEMTDGLAHYDGNDVQYLFHYNQSNVSIFDVVLFEKDVFFLVHEFPTGLSLVYHGKLKKIKEEKG